jgi:AraC-like DNA-binding protein
LREDLVADEFRTYLMGHFAGAMVRLMETITGQDLRARVTIHWPFEEPACAQAYREFCPQCSFGATALRIELPLDLLTCPSLAPDAEAYRVAWRDCERLLTQQEKGNVTSRVQQRLVACEGEYPTLEQMAEIEHVSARTLIRHLREEGVQCPDAFRPPAHPHRILRRRRHPAGRRWSAAAKADGQPALAITDLSNLFGAVKFYKACRGKGVKPIIGADVWMEPEPASRAAGSPAACCCWCRTARAT